MTAPRQTCPAIVGPTAVGKTGLMMRLARAHPIEVISLDSRQVYRGLRIGTAQPTPDELAVCPHHLIDFVSPEEKYDASRFRQDFTRVFTEIVGRGACPLLVGGAGLYLTALREGFLDIPGHSAPRLAEVRAELSLWTDEQVRQELARVDPVSWRRIHQNDRYRSQRALEIQRISGQAMTALMAEQRTDPALGLTFPAFALQRPVAELDARIQQRAEQMLHTGWLTETEEALARFPARCPGLRTIGYREIVGHLTGSLARQDLLPAIVLATRQYAKRQRTMFRQLGVEGHWHPDDPELATAVRGVLDEG